MKNKIVIYQSSDGLVKIEAIVDASNETKWAKQKAMEHMNIKLTNVLSDIVGKSGKAEIALSLEGTWDADHLFELKQSHELYEFYQKKD